MTYSTVIYSNSIMSAINIVLNEIKHDNAIIEGGKGLYISATNNTLVLTANIKLTKELQNYLTEHCKNIFGIGNFAIEFNVNKPDLDYIYNCYL